MKVILADLSDNLAMFSFWGESVVDVNESFIELMGDSNPVITARHMSVDARNKK